MDMIGYDRLDLCREICAGSGSWAVVTMIELLYFCVFSFKLV